MPLAKKQPKKLPRMQTETRFGSWNLGAGNTLKARVLYKKAAKPGQTINLNEMFLSRRKADRTAFNRFLKKFSVKVNEKGTLVSLDGHLIQGGGTTKNKERVQRILHAIHEWQPKYKPTDLKKKKTRKN